MIRTRFAPSPTGMLHIGALRTALFSYLWARRNGGQFFLRIEDTDRARSIPGSIQQIVDSLRWAGIEPDAGPTHASLNKLGEDFAGAWPDAETHGIPGPFVQSERLALYRAHAEKLVREGKAYRCNETAAELEQMRAAAQAEKRGFLFRKQMRLRTEISPDDPNHVIRLEMPASGTVTLNDFVMGDVTFDYANVDDPILVKADAERSSTYHLAAMYDDHAMGVTHIVRSTEWLPSTPKHLWLFHASGWPLPKFAHVPNVNDDSGKKLSKRKGAPSMFDFRDKGYLPEAVMNYMALLGWNPGGGDEQNVFTPAELEQKFDLHRVGSSPAIFSYPKLDWLNAQHIRRMPEDALVARLKPVLQRVGIAIDTPQREAQLLALIPHILPRLNTLADAAALVDFVFGDIDTPARDALIGPKMELHLSRHALTAARDALSQQAFDDEAALEAVLRDLCTELNLKPNQLFTMIRNAVSNKAVTPPLFGVLRALGKTVTLARLDAALKVLGG